MSILRGFVVTLRVLPTAFYTPSFHVYVFVYSRFSWADFGRIFSCLAYVCSRAYVHVFPAGLAVQNVVASPILVRLLCKYPSRVGGITFTCLRRYVHISQLHLLLPCTFVCPF